jgi:hypothetical protein
MSPRWDMRMAVLSPMRDGIYLLSRADDVNAFSALSGRGRADQRLRCLKMFV